MVKLARFSSFDFVIWQRPICGKFNAHTVAAHLYARRTKPVPEQVRAVPAMGEVWFRNELTVVVLEVCVDLGGG